MGFQAIGRPVSDRAGETERVVLSRLVEQRKAWAVCRVDLCMEIPPDSRHHGQGLRGAPFILKIKPEPVLPGKLIEHVERDGIMPVIEAIGQPI